MRIPKGGLARMAYALPMAALSLALMGCVSMMMHVVLSPMSRYYMEHPFNTDHKPIYSILATKFAVNPATPANKDLVLAILAEEREKALSLLESGADPNTFLTDTYDKMHDRWTPLMLAAWSGDIQLVQALLDKGANVDAYADFFTVQFTALNLAAGSGRLDMVKLLLAKGADVNRERGGYSALHSAAYQGHQELAQLLFKAGADKDVVISALKADASRNASIVDPLPQNKEAVIRANRAIELIGNLK